MNPATAGMCMLVQRRPTICRAIADADKAHGRRVSSRVARKLMEVVARKVVDRSKSYLVDEAMIHFFCSIEWTLVVQSVVSPRGAQ